MRFLLIMVITAFSLRAAEEAKAPVGVTVSLVAENRGITAGKPFWVGMRIQHHPKFHTYWRNPGIAGVPTQLAWKLPAGFRAGAIQWPYPEKSMMAVHPVHGYEREVMLLVEIRPPAEIAEPAVTLEAEATWMACADGCYPGKRMLALKLPVVAKEEPDPAVKELFGRTRAELPRPAADWETQVVSKPDAAEIRIRFTPLAAGHAIPADPYFFSDDGQISSDQPQRIEPGAGGSFDLVARRSDYGPAKRTTLPGVLISPAALTADGRKFAAFEPAYPAAEAGEKKSPSASSGSGTEG